uniref:Uncharacterized protein n=1 Tax=Avena sativa TaxID=4498 RepID=A0ACD5X017_AVESA
MTMPSLLISFILLLLAVVSTDAATIYHLNKCPYTVWPAAIPEGGGIRLDPGQSAIFHAPAGTKAGRIWGRTGCNFDANGQGSCSTGDCGGVLACTLSGKPPVTLVEYTLASGSGSDFYDISLVDGFNVPMSIAPVAGSGCHAISCAADINVQCPPELKVEGGCASACLKFNTPQYCCPAPATPATCPPTDYSSFFKRLCPDAYSYAYDDRSSTFTCAAGTDYQVTFCP